MEEDNNNLDMALNTDNNIAVESDEENEERQGVDKMLKLLRSNNFQHLLGLFLNMLLRNTKLFIKSLCRKFSCLQPNAFVSPVGFCCATTAKCSTAPLPLSLHESSE